MNYREQLLRDGVVVLPLDLKLRDVTDTRMLRRAVLDAPLVQPLRELLAPDGRKTSATFDIPTAHPLDWHFDQSWQIVWPLAVGGRCQLTVIAARDDFTETNGATEFEIGSHLGERRGVFRAVMPSGHAVAFFGTHVRHRRWPRDQQASRCAVGVVFSGLLRDATATTRTPW